jgi:hypothetical protein
MTTLTGWTIGKTTGYSLAADYVPLVGEASFSVTERAGPETIVAPQRSMLL